ncbi:hypothetical protein K474DRAFT_452056 [Panus rudis PR-1116 ss-1]|nr:hypothetical protein K474DRAFT_452056 [Panus rudis PR-1116 ss-1]
MSRTVVLKSKRMKNNRGMHLFTLYGYDRQNTGWIKAPSFERDGSNGEVFWAYYVPGSVLYRLTGHINRLLELFFPKIAQRMKDVNYQIKRKYGYISPFGYFWNFCINAPLSSEGIHRVFCQPHIDAENGALLVCAVFVYYYGKVPTKGKEHVWLVLWEAGLIIEVPPGVAILYPSALFLHFNIDIRHLDRIQLGFTTGPGLPTKETLKSLSCENSEEGGRASMVWFTQATILQSADLPDGVHTVGQAKDMEKTAQREAPRAEPYYTATYDVADALARGLFPVKSYTQDIQALSTMEPSIADNLD